LCLNYQTVILADSWTPSTPLPPATVGWPVQLMMVHVPMRVVVGMAGLLTFQRIGM
jgi:hypothetical protein